MDLSAMQTDVKTWAASVTALPVAWANEARAMQVKLPARVELDGPTNFVNVGQDWVQYSAASPTTRLPTVVGNREFTVIIRVVSRSQIGNESAPFFLDKLRTSLKMPSVLAHFQASELAIVRMGPIAKYDAVFDGRMESIHAAELRLAAAISQSDIAIGQIDSVGVTSELKDSAGQLLTSPPNGTQVIDT